MHAINRVNPRGIQYFLMELPERKTQIRTKRNGIEVNFDIYKMSRAWQRWIQHKMLIQDAFPFLSADEREFLQTGITPDEWNEIFKQKVTRKDVE